MPAVSEPLKSCPFCGRYNVFVEGDSIMHYVRCQDCHTHGPRTYSKKSAGEKWNIRPNEMPEDDLK